MARSRGVAEALADDGVGDVPAGGADGTRVATHATAVTRAPSATHDSHDTRRDAGGSGAEAGAGTERVYRDLHAPRFAGPVRDSLR